MKRVIFFGIAAALFIAATAYAQRPVKAQKQIRDKVMQMVRSGQMQQQIGMMRGNLTAEQRQKLMQLRNKLIKQGAASTGGRGMQMVQGRRGIIRLINGIGLRQQIRQRIIKK